MTVLHAVLAYLRNRQSPRIRFLHIVVLFLVISQIIISNFIGFTKTGQISGDTLTFYGTWAHIIMGLSLLPIGFVFAFLVLKEHGFQYFYPYFFSDFNQLKIDINKLKKIELPDPEAGGLAAIVKGLGLGALFLALLSGLTWFLAWRYNARWSHSIKDLHAVLVGLIEAYVVGHGGMGLLHIYLLTKNSKSP